MIQTINIINSYDGRCLDVRFLRISNTANQQPQFDSHSYSYLHSREFYQKEMGDEMGLDRVSLELTDFDSGENIGERQ